MPDKDLQDRLILAAQTLAAVEGSAGFTIPIPGTVPQKYVSLHTGAAPPPAPDTPPSAMPTPEELREAILTLLAAKHAGGSVDVLNAKELERVASEWDIAPEELMDCVLSVGSGVAPLREFIKIR
jgi:hypothetical protein